jgi:hypothetical protein
MNDVSGRLGPALPGQAPKPPKRTLDPSKKIEFLIDFLIMRAGAMTGDMDAVRELNSAMTSWAYLTAVENAQNQEEQEDK